MASSYWEKLSLRRWMIPSVYIWAYNVLQIESHGGIPPMTITLFNKTLLKDIQWSPLALWSMLDSTYIVIKKFTYGEHFSSQQIMITTFQQLKQYINPLKWWPLLPRKTFDKYEGTRAMITTITWRGFFKHPIPLHGIWHAFKYMIVPQNV